MFVELTLSGPGRTGEPLLLNVDQIEWISPLTEGCEVHTTIMDQSWRVSESYESIRSELLRLMQDSNVSR